MNDLVNLIQNVGGPAVAAYLAKDGIEKLLGPTAQYLGESARDFTKRRAEATAKIFARAAAKLGGKIEQPGEVPPKVLRVVLNEGSFANTELAVEYFGGLLASARTDSGRDDRTARLAKQVDSLSVYQLRAHFLIYAAIREMFKDDGLRFNIEGRPKMRIFIGAQEFNEAMDFSESEQLSMNRFYDHTLFGLYSESLIGNWMTGQKEDLQKSFPNAPSGGMLIEPSSPGAELFLAAHGENEQPLGHLFELPIEFPDGIQPLKNVMKTR